MCHRRSRGYPLQYILGDQPFGDLEILCRRGVLIPRSDLRRNSQDSPLTRYARPDTETYTYEAAKLIRQSLLKGRTGSASESPQRAQSLRILDLCTGTGCIALLLHALLAPHVEQMQVLGIDISPQALRLAQRNLCHNVQRGLLAPRASAEIEFCYADVFGRDVEDILPKLDRPGDISCDLMISNPPYISTSDFRDGTTARSVRLFEPRLALVPSRTSLRNERDRPEDVFYRHLLSLSFKLRPKVTVLECGDLAQARRVVDMYRELSPHRTHDMSVSIWPSTEQELAASGFHPHDGSRCVVIQRT